MPWPSRPPRAMTSECRSNQRRFVLSGNSICRDHAHTSACRSVCHKSHNFKCIILQHIYKTYNSFTILRYQYELFASSNEFPWSSLDSLIVPSQRVLISRPTIKWTKFYLLFIRYVYIIEKCVVMYRAHVCQKALASRTSFCGLFSTVVQQPILLLCGHNMHLALQCLCRSTKGQFIPPTPVSAHLRLSSTAHSERSTQGANESVRNTRDVSNAQSERRTRRERE